MRTFFILLLSFIFIVHARAADVTLQEKGSSVVVTMPLANTEEARQRGLMHITHLPERAGLLFDFTNSPSGERIVYMWMKNTPLSLDMIFVKADGRIIHIEPSTVPESENIISSTQSVRFVIEVAAGQAEAMGWSVGDCITFKGQLPLLPNMCK